MMQLLERFVIAWEKIAKALAVLITSAVDTAEPVGGSSGTQGSPSGEHGDDVYPAKGDREGWFEEAKKRGIKIAGNARTATIIKRVEEWDKMQGVDDPPDSASAEPPTPETEDDPFAVKAEEITREMVLERLQKIQKDKGNERVIEILDEFGGVSMLRDLPEEKYAAVYKGAANG